MVTFYNIKDIDKFFKTIDSCKGRVLLKSSDNQMIDLRKNVIVRELLDMIYETQGIDKLALVIEDNQDMLKIMRYLMECNSNSSLKQIS